MAEEIEQVLGRLLRPFFQAVFGNLSADQQSAFIFWTCVLAIVLASGYTVVTGYKHRRRFRDELVKFHGEARTAFVAVFREVRLPPKPIVSIFHRTLLLVSAVLLLLAAFTSWPYNFYIVLRWVVCSVAVYTITALDRKRFFIWTSLFALVAFLFNPILRLHLDRDIWAWLNLLSAAIVLTFAVIAAAHKPQLNGIGSETKSEKVHA